MGTSESKQVKCPYCTALISTSIEKSENNGDEDQECNDYKPCKGTKQCLIASQLPNTLLFCSRCHGTVRNKNEIPKNKNKKSTQTKSPKSNKNSKNDTISPPLKQPKLQKRGIEHLYIAPFEESLLNLQNNSETECKEMNSHILTENYLKPFFEKTKEKQQAIRRGNRLIIDGIEFKVFACYPPKGFVNENTRFHLSDNHRKNLPKNELFTSLNGNILQSIHLLPTKISLSTYYKKHNIPDPNDPSNKNNNKKRNRFFNNNNNNSGGSHSVLISDLNEHEQSDSNDEHKTQNENHTSNHDDTHAHCIDIHVKDAITKQLKLYLKGNDRGFYLNMKEEQKEQHSHGFGRQSRHLMEGETLIASDGIEWRVMKCKGNDIGVNNGVIDPATTSIFYDSCNAYLDDCKSLSIRPIYESLPRMHQNCTPKQIYKLYLDSYFFGGIYRSITPRREISINGVSFAVRNVEPNHGGIVTCNTKLDYFATAVKHQDLMEMIHDEDLEMAQKLENEQNERLYALQMSAERRRRRAQMDQNDIEAMIDRYRMQPDPFLSLMAMIAGPPNGNDAQGRKKKKGISKKLIRLLPTYKFSTPTSSMSDMKTADADVGDGDGNEETEPANVNFSCRICLEYYENEEELRILPCFHKYHKDCVDKWMGISPNCPICKTSIVKQLQR